MAPGTDSHLAAADIGVLVSYFVLVICIGIFAMYRSKRNTVGGYFLAGRSMTFLPIGASLFVSNIGTQHFIGLAGSGAASGISVGAWEFNALLILQLTGWIFLPVYIACGTFTMPEYLAKRFGGTRLRIYYAVLSLILYIFTKCSSDLYTGALFIQQSLRWDLYVSIIMLVLVTAILTITGGLTAVIYTDTLQAGLMVGGALYLMFAGFQEIGGFSGLLEKYPQAVPTNESAIVPGTTCHHPDTHSFTMLRGVSDDYMPWLGFLLGQTPGSIWYWCADQVIVQRALAAKSIAHAQGATLLAGFIKILPLFFMVMPGMIARILYPAMMAWSVLYCGCLNAVGVLTLLFSDEVACTNPDYCMSVCQSRTGCSSIAYPKLVMGLMPDGARGLMMAVIVAALMSDLDSIFNSASTLFTIDIWTKLRKKSSVTEQMIVGRLFIVVMVAVSIAWVPMIQETQGGQVFIYINEVINYIAPPFSAVFLLGVLVPRVNEKGVFWSLMYALVVGLIRFTLVFVYKGPSYCGDHAPSPPSILANFHYMYFALFTFGSTGLLALVISYFTDPPSSKCLENTTLWSYYKRDKDSSGSNSDVEGKMLHQLQNSGSSQEPDSCEAADEIMVCESPRERKVRDPPKGLRRVLYFILGLTHMHDQADDQQQQQLKEHIAIMAALKKTKFQSVILTVGLVAIVSIGTASYIFWSVYRFDHAPFYPSGASNLLPGDEHFLPGYTHVNTTYALNVSSTVP